LYTVAVSITSGWSSGIRQCNDGQTSTEKAANVCGGRFGELGNPGTAKVAPKRALSRSARVKRGIRSPPCTGRSWSSGTPAAFRRLMASLLAMTVAPVLIAMRSAPGRLLSASQMWDHRRINHKVEDN
jgi:hypothetical protein